MDRKDVRTWFKDHRNLVESIDGLRKECEGKDLTSLLGMVELTGDSLERVKLVLIAEIVRSRGLLDQTKKG